MIRVKKKEWNEIHKNYKGCVTQEMIDYSNGRIPQSYLGKREVLSGCISDEIGALLTEGVHFIIV